MSSINIVGLVPIKLQSRRLPNKNFLNLAGKPLVNHILETLTKVNGLSRVCVYCSNSIIENLLPPGVEFVRRPAWTDGDDVTGSQLYYQAALDIEADYFLQTHATNPLVRPETLQRAVDLILSGETESIVGSQAIQKFSWFKGLPLNYDPAKIQKTQDLEPVYVETSSFYLYSRQLMISEKKRVSNKPCFVEIEHEEAVDIDHEQDFKFAEKLLNSTSTSMISTTPQPHELALIELVPTRDAIELVIFDMDGVLVDSKANMECSWKAVQERFGIDVPFERYFENIGRPFVDIMNILGLGHLADELESVYFSSSRFNSDLISFYDDALASVRRIKEAGLKTAIVTSKERNRTHELLGDAVSLFDLIVCPDSTNRGKPAPDPILKVCVDVEVDPHNTLYVGDMSVDHESAKRAGVSYAHAGWGYGKPNDSRVVWFAEIKDLASFLVDR